MTGLKQQISDLVLIVRTDRRVWAFAGFVGVALTVWSVTGSWRNLEEPLPPKFGRYKIEEEKIKSLVDGFNKTMNEGREERRFLRNYIDRVQHEVSVSKDEIDWQVNVLVNKLDAMTEKVDGLTNDIGRSTIEDAQFESRLGKQKKKKKKR